MHKPNDEIENKFIQLALSLFETRNTDRHNPRTAIPHLKSKLKQVDDLCSQGLDFDKCQTLKCLTELELTFAHKALGQHDYAAAVYDNMSLEIIESVLGRPPGSLLGLTLDHILVGGGETFYLAGQREKCVSWVKKIPSSSALFNKAQALLAQCQQTLAQCIPDAQYSLGLVNPCAEEAHMALAQDNLPEAIRNYEASLAHLRQTCVNALDKSACNDQINLTMLQIAQLAMK